LNAHPHGATVQVTVGGVLINTGETVKLYSRDFADIRELLLPLDKEGRLITSVSPTGKTVMVNRFNPKLNVSHLDLYDAATLTSEKSWSQSPRLYYDHSISDKGIAALQKPGIVAADFGQTTWAVVGKAIGNCGGNLPTLYSDDQLVYGCTKLVAASISGQVLMTDVFRDGEQASAKKAVAQRGRFVAVSLDTTEVKQHIFSEATVRVIGTRIVVYDLTQRKKILTVSIDPLPTNDYDFALSPDGSKLAILNDRKVSVYVVPVHVETSGE
jgi:hypothetical protein